MSPRKSSIPKRPVHLIKHSTSWRYRTKKRYLDKHIGEMLSSSSRLRKILESENARKVFVPKEWTGIKGFLAQDLKFRPSFPESHRIRSRPINPELYESAKKEFERLKHYMFKDSTSPWASTLVIAPKATTPFIRFFCVYRWLKQLVILPQAYILMSSTR